MNNVFARMRSALHIIKKIGFRPGMDEYEKRKLGIFNLLNFFGLISGLLVPFAGFFNQDHLPLLAWVVAFSPFFISFSVLMGNYYGKYETARVCYFIFYPLITGLVYATGMDVGIQLFFILYGLLSVFFLKRIAHVLFSFSLSMLLYFMVSVVNYRYTLYLKDSNYPFYVFNNALAVAFIFYSLYLIKQENARYQQSLLRANSELNLNNIEINQQKTEIDQKATLLEAQTQQLSELNAVKNKLFSVISHDLKGPLYALRNLFRNMQQFDTPANEIKMIIPDVVNDLNYTTGLMENLLQWAKSQMQAEAIHKQVIDLRELIEKATRLLKLQADSKQVYLETRTDKPVYVYADIDMVDLVIRNILSNAIKFTPSRGNVSLKLNKAASFAEVIIEDTGMGMNAEALEKIRRKTYYTTKGTANESGTGLGLMLCQEFLSKNGGRMHIESEEGKGTTFSFTLPVSN